jgi:hypothetical protein
MTPSQMLASPDERSETNDLVAPVAPQALRNSTGLQPSFPHRTPSTELLKNLGAESSQPLPTVDEATGEVPSGEEMIDITTDTSSIPKPNTTQTVTLHSAQIGTGQTLQADFTPVSIATAQSQTLPVPYSPNQVAPSIEQVGFRRIIETGNNASTASGNQNKTVVYINNAPSR